MSSVKILINDIELEARPAQTIMEAADEAGIAIPRLCNHPALKPGGSCRLCSVEIEGSRGLPAACTTPVEEGMSIRTESPKVLDFRREMLRLILQEHPRECQGCHRNGTCELQELVTRLGIDFPYIAPTDNRPPPMDGGAYFERDYSLCVRCGRCVRVCHEVRGAKAIVFRERGGRQEVGTPLGMNLAEAGCEFCGSCLDVCPVGALREKLEIYDGEPRRHILEVCENLANIVMSLYQSEAPRSSNSSVCPICPAGCAMDFEISESDETIRVRPSIEPSGHRGHSCVQGRFRLKGYLGRENRLIHPVVGRGEGFEEKDWEEALGLVSEKIASFGRDEIAVLANDRLSNEDHYLLHKFAAEVLNTKVVGVLGGGRSLYGQTTEMSAGGLGTPGRPDCILTFGLNTPATDPVAGIRIRQAVMGGARLIVAGPCETATARYADVTLRHYPGVEPVLLSGLLRLIVEKNCATGGDPELNALKDRLSAYDPRTVSRATGASESDLIEAARLIEASDSLSILYGAGVCESAERAEALRAFGVLLEAGEKAGKTTGALLRATGAGNSLGQAAVASAFAAPNQEAVLGGISSGKIKALHLVGEDISAEALESLRPWIGKLDFVLLQDMCMPGKDFLDILPAAAVLLPSASILESGGTFARGGGKNKWIQAILQSPGQAKPLGWVLGSLARTLGVEGFDYAGPAPVLKELLGKIPFFARSGAAANGNRAHLSDWTPAPLGSSPEPPDEEFPFALAPKDRIAPYFLGPLLARETSVLFDSGADIEMSPADLFPMGFQPGETVRVVVRGAELEGRVGLNRFLIPKMAAIGSEVLRDALRDANGEFTICAAKIEKR